MPRLDDDYDNRYYQELDHLDDPLLRDEISAILDPYILDDEESWEEDYEWTDLEDEL